jgi:DNA polymerase III delta prime subunit
MKNNTIWCEKYRPKSVSELVGNQNIVDALVTYAERSELPNMLMAGSLGCGKTSAVQSLANDCVLPNGEYLEIKTSDERGIETVRNKLKLFSGKKLSENCMRLIFLDEADGMTSHAQLALKALMDTYSSKVTFVLSCNDITCIHESIISRCVTFRFQQMAMRMVLRGS